MIVSLEATLRKADKLQKAGNLDQAIGVLEDVLTRFPKNRRAAQDLTKLKDQAFEPPVSIRADIEQAFRSGDYLGVIAQCQNLTGRYPRSAFLWRHLGLGALRSGQFDQSLVALGQAISLTPQSGIARCDLGDAYKALGRHEQAIESYTNGLRLKPDHVSGWNNLGNALLGVGRGADAVEALLQASALAGGNAQIAFNLANAYQSLGDLDLAERYFSKAAERSAGFAEAFYNLGLVQRLKGNLPAAISSFESVLALKPDHDQARAEKLHQQAHICDFKWAEEFSGLPSDFGARGAGAAPFAFLAMEDAPLKHRKRSALYAKRMGLRDRPAALPDSDQSGRKKIRVGYFSADFHDHATMHLLAGLFDHHDRDRFEIFIYSFGPSRQDSARLKLISNVDHFHDLMGSTNDHIQEVAHQDGLDIAVDLKGYTGENRSGIFRDRVAPVQIAYLGYPGTSGCTVFDYVIADQVVLPPEQRESFSEQAIYLPGSYQINDDTRAIDPHAPSRRECGLPEQGFVFCCFNNSYKITPEVFDLWMRLLTYRSDAVLWLLQSNDWSVENLRKEAAKRGVDPKRLVFAPRLPAAQHLARQSCADLFLDTFPCNAHTTASDALWGGLPVLTCAGKHFATRVAASLLSAAELPELITTNLPDYEAVAKGLLDSPEQLNKLRDRLAARRTSCALFDTAATTRHLETAFETAIACHRSGALPHDFVVDRRN